MKVHFLLLAYIAYIIDVYRAKNILKYIHFFAKSEAISQKLKKLFIAEQKINFM